MQEVSLKSIIAPIFYPVYRSIKNEEYTYYWMKGGRSSTKSSFISIAFIMGILRDPLANGVIFMKAAVNLRQAVYEQILWAIDVLNLHSLFITSISPLKITYTQTGQVILFRGLDDAHKTKSIKFRKGYCKCVWFEELSEFDSWEEVRTALNSLFRKSSAHDNPHFSVFLSYNPPKDPNNWVNKEANKKRSDRLINHSTYLDVPREWLTDAFIAEAEYLKINDPVEYEHEYLGKIVGLKGRVYPMFNRSKHLGGMLKDEIVHTAYIGCDGGTVKDSTTLVPLLLTTAGRIIIPQTFCYDPTLPGHTPLAPSSQIEMMEGYLFRLADRFSIDLDRILIVVDSAAQDICLEFNKSGYFKAIPVAKKDVLLDMKRVQGILTASGYVQIINEGYKDPVTGSLINDDDILITELESLVINEKTGKPEDGNDHSIDALKYGSYYVYYGEGGF